MMAYTIDRVKTLPLWLVGIMMAHFLLAVGFGLGPIFEGPDELEHYRFIRYLADHRALPNPTGQPYGQYHQAPLYYVLLAPIAALLPDVPAEELSMRANPYHGYRSELPGNDNKNVYVHTRTEQFPYPDPTARAVHILRLTSALLGVTMVLVSYQIFRILWEERPILQLLATSLVAFWPKLVYMFSVLNNDTLVIVLTTAALYLVLSQQKHGFTGRRAVLLGVVLGASLLTKATSAVLVIPVGIAALIDRRTWKYAVVTLVVTLVVAGWWYARNIILVGDPIGIGAVRETWPDRHLQSDKHWIITGLRNGYQSRAKLWTRFGHGAVTVTEWIDYVFDGMILLALVGLGLRSVKHLPLYDRVENRIAGGRKMALEQAGAHRLPHAQAFQISHQKILSTVTLVTWIVAYIVALLYYSGTATHGTQLRYVLPSITPIVALMVLGLNVWLQWILPRVARATLFPLGLLALTVMILFGHFYPAYRARPVPNTVPRPLDISYEGIAELIGMSPEYLQAEPGERLIIDLYWRAMQPAPSTMQTYLHGVGAQGFLWRDSLPGNGHRPADDWQAGDTWAERYVVFVAETVSPGTEYVLVAGLYDTATTRSLEGSSSTGESLSVAPIIGTLTISEKP